MIILLVGLFTGMVLSLQSYSALVKFGAEGSLGTLVVLTLSRELGPVFTAIMITARAGSAITAEIGSQRISDQIDALNTMRIESIKYLVRPRMAAAIISFPLHTALFNFIGILGRYITGVVLLHVNAGTYFYRIHASTDLRDVAENFIKAIAFALIVSTICCFQGYFAQLRADSHGAKAVGRTTTSGGVIRSLEGLQEELTGLYSRRQIKVLYHNQLKRRVLGEAYCVILLTLTNLDLLTAELGHKAVQMTIRSMGAFMDRQFGAIGGFCTRHSINEFVAMLPYSDAGECEGLLKNFAADLRQRGIYCLGNRSGNGSPSERSVEVALRSGIAQDQPTAELDAVI